MMFVNFLFFPMSPQSKYKYWDDRFFSVYTSIHVSGNSPKRNENVKNDQNMLDKV